MVTTPDKIKKLIRQEQVIIVGTVHKGICNVSPRTSFYLDQDGSIYWLELFRHKTFRNLQKNQWCTIVVFDKKKLVGYQLKGKATIITDRKIKSQIRLKIIDRLTRLHRQRILEQSNNKRPSLVQFIPKIVFSLNPNELADSPLMIDASNESLRTSDLQW
ncbi:MAG: pyridoxamine 5'-phosphate oxidase family protein [Candidatus Nitrosotenuis sp.]